MTPTVIIEALHSLCDESMRVVVKLECSEITLTENSRNYKHMVPWVSVQFASYCWNVFLNYFPKICLWNCFPSYVELLFVLLVGYFIPCQVNALFNIQYSASVLYW